MLTRLRSLAAALVLVGCGHSEPFTVEEPEPLGPFTDVIPRRLTFNPGDDRSPAALGRDLVVYSRLDLARDTPGRCLTLIPAEGGTIRASHCPPPPSAIDTFASTWLEPALSPDGARIAFLWVRFATFSTFGAWTHHLAVGPADSPLDTTFTLLVSDTLPDGRRFNTLLKPSWAGDRRIRFLAAFDSIIRVTTGGRAADTLITPRGLVEVDLDSGVLRVVSGADSAAAYAPAPDGGAWFVRLTNRSTLVHLVPGSTLPTVIGSFGGAAADLADVDGLVAAALPLVNSIAWIDPITGAGGFVPTPGPVHRITGVLGGFVVGEVEAPGTGFGGPANLWLFSIP